MLTQELNKVRNNRENNKRIAKNSLMLYLRMVFMTVINLYTSRIVLQTLGVEDLGIYNVVGGIIFFLSFLTGSLSAASSRFITYALGQNNLDNSRKVFGNIVYIHLLFAAIIILVGETLGLWFVSTQLNIAINRMEAALWVYHFSVLTSALTLMYTPYNAMIIAQERMSAFAYITISDAILKLLIAILLPIIPYDRLIAYALLTFCIYAFDFFIYFFYTVINFAEVKAKLVLDKVMFKEMFIFAGWTMNGNLAVFGYTQGLNILLNIFFNTTINAARAIAVQVQHVASTFCYNFQMALNPQLTKNYAQKNYYRMHELLIFSSKYSVFLLLFICIPMILEAPLILSWWLGSYPNYTVIFIRYTLLITLLTALANPIIISVHATGNLKKFQLIEGSILLMIVPIAYVLLKYFNTPPESVFVTHICIEICTQYTRLKIVFPMIKLDIHKYFKLVIKPILLVCITAPIIPIIIFLCLPQNLLTFIIICTISCINIALSIFWLGCTALERSFIFNKIILFKTKYFHEHN